MKHGYIQVGTLKTRIHVDHVEDGATLEGMGIADLQTCVNTGRIIELERLKSAAFSTRLHSSFM